MSQKDWDSIANQEVENNEQSEDYLSDDPFAPNESAEAQPEVKQEQNPELAIVTLEQELKEVKAKAEADYDRAVRAASELENVRKRSEKEIVKARMFAVEKFAKELMPVLDSLEQALATFDNSEVDVTSQREGVQLTLKMFMDALEKSQITQIDPEGKPFDPNLHEAMSAQPSGDHAPNTVIAVFQKGYMLHDRVIRPARVVVSKALEGA